MPGLSRVVAPLLATVCGVFTAYAAFQPPLAQQQEERLGNVQKQVTSDNEQEKAISNAILSDLREARDEVDQYSNGGFAWGIRKALFGYDPRPSGTSKSTKAIDVDSSQGEDSTTTK